MTLVLGAALRSMLTAALTLGLWRLARHRSAAFRHWILACGLLTTAIVMPASFLLPRWAIVPSLETLLPAPRATISQQLTNDVAEPSSSPVAAPAEARPSRIDAATIAIGIWSLGVAASLARLLFRLYRLRVLSARALPVFDGPWPAIADATAREYALHRRITIRHTQAPHVVATWGLRVPVVLISSDALGWDPAWIRIVLRHELAHVQRHDWLLQLAGEVVRALHWFNPLIWVVCAKLRQDSECACDDIVIQTGVPVQTYAGHLIDIARRLREASSPLPALPIAAPSTLEQRITMLLNTDRDRRRPSARAVCLILLGALLAGGTLATTGVFAQATAGSLVGHVYDTSGAVLPAVEVVLENEQHTPWATMTDATGRFEFTPVGAGKYRLRAILAGFRSLNEELDLQTSQDWNRSVTLQVGELEETIHVTAHRPAGRTPATAAFAEPVRIGGNIKPPAKLVNVPPVYPQALRDAGMEGTVRMEALIAQDGSVASVRTLSAQVHPDFARSAEAAVRQWRFSQTLLNGVAVEVRMIVSVTFSLTD